MTRNLLLVYKVAWKIRDDVFLVYQTQATSSGKPPRSRKFTVLPQTPWFLCCTTCHSKLKPVFAASGFPDNGVCADEPEEA